MTKIAFPILLLVVSQAFAAGGVDDMYSEEQLANDKARYEPRIKFLFWRGLWDFMDGAEKEALAGVRIEHPLKGSSPLDAYSRWDVNDKTVVLPVLSLKFIEDLSTAYAWRYVNQFTLQPSDEYLAMLKYCPEKFPGARVPDPLTALGVPPRIGEQDKKVEELARRFRNSAWAFILAHELGHLRFLHRGNRNVDPLVSQRNEVEADAFAVHLLERSDTIPMGMILWFQAGVGYLPNRADFAKEAEFLDWVRREATHPMNSERLKRLAVTLDREADAGLNRNHADVLRFIAGKLVQIGDILAEPDMQRLIARKAVLGRPEDLKRLQDPPSATP
jgi:hypothetical protein